MLNALRKGAKGIFVKLLIGLLVFAFAIWGINDFVNQVDRTEVAEAGDTPVSRGDFERAYLSLINQQSRQLGTALTPEQARALGLPSQAISVLVSRALQVDAAHALGLDLGDEALTERITSSPQFQTASGNFSRAALDAVLANNRMSEATFIEAEREVAAQEMWVNSLVGGLSTPEPYLRAVNRFLNQTRTTAWFRLTDDAIGPIEDPSEATLRAFYEANRSDFRAPEYRAVAAVTLSPEALAEPNQVSADAVRREYETAGAYGEPERREVQQIVLNDAERAEQIASQLNGETTLETVMDDLGLTLADIDLGLVTRAELADPAVAEAAFTLDEGAASVVDGRFGSVVVRVAEIAADAKQPLEAVEDEIRRTLALEAARDEADGLYNSVVDAVAGGATVAEIGERFDLPVATVDAVNAEGETPDGEPTELASAAVAAAFRVDEGDDAEPVDVGDGTTWVQVTGITEAADRPFEEVEFEVLAAWTEAEKAGALDRLAAEAVERLNAGASIETVAADYGAELQTTAPYSQSNPPAPIPQQAVTASFEGGLGHVASVELGSGAHVILEVTEVSEPAFFAGSADLNPVETALTEGLADSIVLAFVSAWQDEVGVTLNQSVVDEVIGVGR